MKKKIFYLVLCCLLIFIVCFIIGFINSNKYDNTIKVGSFNYEDSITDELVVSKYYYSDSYFKNKSIKDNEHLSTFAMSLALTFKPTYREESVNYYIQSIFDDINIKDVKYYDDEIINKDTIGTVFGHKKLNNKYELVILVIRGAGYEDEWISNFIIGEEGNSKGFDDSSKKVLERLKKYVKENDIDNYKLLVTGYSRGGAVANIVGVKLNNDNSYNINSNDLYVYTFDAAKGSTDNKVYKNIHNVINKNDIITYFYPDKIGFQNNGAEYDITDNTRTFNSKCLSIFEKNKINNGVQVNKKEFLKSLFDILPDNRNEYFKISDSIINLYQLVNNKSDSEIMEIIEFIKNNNSNEIKYSDIINLLITNDDNRIKDVYDKMIINYDKNYSKIEHVLSKDEYSKLKNDMYKLLLFFLPIIKKDLNYSINGNSCPMYHSLTFISNFNEIVKEHTFSNNYNLVISKDSNYN